MSGNGARSGPGGGLTKTSIVLFLVAGLLVVHHFGVREGFDPSAMLALGFVVLASYAFGQLVERVRLPHITGYLLAGIVLGPSVASLLPSWARVPPFDAGVLSTNVQEQLSPLVTLAVALIALTAGGELKIAALRRGFRAIVAVIAGQSVLVMLSVTGLVVLIGGAVPAIRLPGLGELSMTSVASLGAVVAAIALATSPSATIAVVTETRAKGPLTSLVLASVVLKDVVVVFFFSLASTIAVQALGVGESVDLGAFLLVHVGGSLAFGLFVGGLMALYLRFVNRELLVFVVGIVFAARFAADALHLDPVLLFIAAGFAVSNFSDRGGALVTAVETLSLPVYVVFFTLAGAHLDLRIVVAVLPFALALTATRGLALALGSRIGAVLGQAPDTVRRHGWLGYMSQAGVSLSLSTIVAERFGAPGQALASLLLAMIAINELAGPVLFKVGLGLARELPSRGSAPEAIVADDEPPAPDVDEPGAPTSEGGTAVPAVRGPAPWPAPAEI
nr:cation:proton antiporter [Myxococcota bacterium]